MGERVRDAPSAARSPLHPTWEQFCASYEPGRYDRGATPAGILVDSNELRLLLIAARLRIDRLAALKELPHRVVQRVEETSAGSCYGNAA